MTHPLESTLLPPEVHRAILWMRNWVYINLALLFGCIAAAGLIKIDRDFAGVFLVPAPFFIFGMVLCHTVEMRMKIGSLFGATLARVTTIFTIVGAIIGIVGLSIGVVAATMKNHPKELVVEGPILVLLVFFIYPAILTDRVLKRAINAMPSSAQSFGFPVELRQPVQPSASPEAVKPPQNLTTSGGKN